MSDQVFQQNLDDKKGLQPGGPYLIQMLFREKVPMPDKAAMIAVMEKHIGAVECFCHDKKTAGFAALEHIAEFKDAKAPVQLMVMGCSSFNGKGFDPFLLSQMWDCQEDRDRIFRECRYQVVATDMLAAALPTQERAGLDMDFLEALAELYPTCEAFYFQNCGKLLLAEDVRSHQIEGSDRFIRFGVNVRFFTIQDTEDKHLRKHGHRFRRPGCRLHHRGGGQCVRGNRGRRRQLLLHHDPGSGSETLV